MTAATISASQRKTGSITPSVMPSFRPLDCAGSTVRASVNYWAFPVAALFFIAESLSGKPQLGSGQASPRACDEWWCDTGASLQLITPNLPDATTEEAECKRGQNRQNHYERYRHRINPSGYRQLAAQEVTESFLLDWPDLSCGLPVSDSARGYPFGRSETDQTIRWARLTRAAVSRHRTRRVLQGLN